MTANRNTSTVMREKNADSVKPKELFKYYSFDRHFLEGRLSGELYLPSPLEFNDPSDCKFKAKNNIDEVLEEKGDDWLLQVLIELGYRMDEYGGIISALKKDDHEIVLGITNRQLEKLGVLCFTTECLNTLMWGYYSNNNGICIEYDTDILLHDIAVGLVNSMEYTLTRHLFQNMDYRLDIKNRNPELSSVQLTDTAQFTLSDLKMITNQFICEVQNEEESVNFIRNTFTKRINYDKVRYLVSPNDLKPTLFFKKNKTDIQNKYFRKTKKWDHENEYRIVVSLGGKKKVKLSSSAIKAVYCGSGMTNEQILEVSYLLFKNKMTHVKMYRCFINKGNGGLNKKAINFVELCNGYPRIEKMLG